MNKKQAIKQHQKKAKQLKQEYVDVYKAVRGIPDNATVEELEFHRMLLNISSFDLSKFKAGSSD